MPRASKVGGGVEEDKDRGFPGMVFLSRQPEARERNADMRLGLLERRPLVFFSVGNACMRLKRRVSSSAIGKRGTLVGC